MAAHVIDPKAVRRERLRRTAPGIYGDLVAGRIASLRRAEELAGLRDRQSRLEKLQRAWDKAGDEDRRTFLAGLAGERQDAGSPLRPTGMERPGDVALPEPIADGRYLLPRGIALLEARLVAAGMTPTALMNALGFADPDNSLLRAMARGTSLRLSVLAALKAWLQASQDDGGSDRTTAPQTLTDCTTRSSVPKKRM